MIGEDQLELLVSIYPRAKSVTENNTQFVYLPVK